MGRPLNGTARVEELNASLRAALGEAATIPRDKWDRIVCTFYGVGIEMAMNLTRTGEVLGYWRREAGKAGGRTGGGKAGAVRILPGSVHTTSPTPHQGHQAAPGSPLAVATTSPMAVPA